MCSGFFDERSYECYLKGYDDAYAYDCMIEERNKAAKEKKMAKNTKTPIFEPARKLAELITSYVGEDCAITADDIELIISRDWFEVSAYAHAVHNAQKAAANDPSSREK